jgi:hypothetical protein
MAGSLQIYKSTTHWSVMSLKLLRDDGFTLTHRYGDMTLDVTMEPTQVRPAYLTDDKYEGIFSRVVGFAHKRMQDDALTAVEHAVEGAKGAIIGDGDSYVKSGLEDQFPGFVLHLTVGCKLIVARINRYRVQTELADSLLTPVDVYADALVIMEREQTRRRPQAPVATPTPRLQLVQAVRSVLRDFRGRGA